MANTKDAYMKWKEQGLLDAKLKIISDYYSYKEARGLIYNLLGVSEATWERLKKRHEEIRFTIAEAKKLHEQLLLVSITRRAEGEYYEDTQTIIEESNGKTKKKIVKIKKYIPGDVGAGKYLLSRLHGEKYNENKEMLDIARKRQESNFEEWNVNENKNLNLNSLIEYENNPRDNDAAVDAVAASISEFGFKVPIVVDSNLVIVAGHTRLKAARKLGLVEVPCLIADDLTDEQIKAFRLADNKTAELATWDLSKLEEELFDIDMDMLQFGFDEMQSDIPDNATDDDFDPDSEIPEVPVSRKGDLYVLGNHRVLCGDSTIKEDVDVLVNEKLVDMIFTDPPYNVDYEGTAGKIQNDKMEDSAFYTFLLSAFTNMFENTKKGGAIYVCHADTEGLNFRNAYKNAGFKLAECLIWVKNALVLGRQDYHWRHEPILYGWKEGAAHYFVDDRTQDTVWEYNKPKRNEEHPTMKPLELVGKAIANSSRVGEIVLDLFGGSGSTLLAADQLGRSAYLMEYDEKFVDVIIKRYIRHKAFKNDSFYRLREGVKTPLSQIPEFNLED